MILILNKYYENTTIIKHIQQGVKAYFARQVLVLMEAFHLSDRLLDYRLLTDILVDIMSLKKRF